LNPKNEILFFAYQTSHHSVKKFHKRVNHDSMATGTRHFLIMSKRPGVTTVTWLQAAPSATLFLTQHVIKHLAARSVYSALLLASADSSFICSA
jgi:hypothetical protein